MDFKDLVQLESEIRGNAFTDDMLLERQEKKTQLEVIKAKSVELEKDLARLDALEYYSIHGKMPEPAQGGPSNLNNLPQYEDKGYIPQQVGIPQRNIKQQYAIGELPKTSAEALRLAKDHMMLLPQDERGLLNEYTQKNYLNSVAQLAENYDAWLKVQKADHGNTYWTGEYARLQSIMVSAVQQIQSFKMRIPKGSNFKPIIDPQTINLFN